ncbi:MAG: PHB depolymerase family esterase [Candidatus Omnitrophica bacterium]|nr:PHB depolymerase family esterase [Candidatus Omnitrophota bacterium]
MFNIQSNPKIWLKFIIVIIILLSCPIFIYAQTRLGERIREKINQRRQDRIAEESLIGQDIEKSIVVDGIKRTYIIHLPPRYKKVKIYPIVFVFHGGGGNAENAIMMSGMSEKADKEGFIVVYPNGTGRFKNRFLTWNTWNGCGYAFEQNVDDVKFINNLIEKLGKELNVDSKRVFAAGMSNGGMMAYRLACECSDKIAAIASVSGALNSENPNPAFPVSIIAFHGTADNNVPYNGGTGKRSIEKNRVDKPVSYAINFWVKYDGCNTTPIREESGNIIQERYTGGKEGTEVLLYTVKGGGHAWPGGKAGRTSGNVDQPTQEISATDLMWEFFQKHPKP